MNNSLPNRGSIIHPAMPAALRMQNRYLDIAADDWPLYDALVALQRGDSWPGKATQEHFHGWGDGKTAKTYREWLEEVEKETGMT